MSRLIKQAAEHGLFSASEVIVLTIEHKTGTRRRLYRYATGVDWAKVGLYTDKVPFKVTYEAWDGEENVSFYNGD